MTTKKKNLLFLISLILVFSLLAWTGTFASGPKKDTGLNRSPDLSAGGETIVFTYTGESGPRLYTAPSDGGDATLHVSGAEDETFATPDFSKDGSEIVFIKQWTEKEKPYSVPVLYDTATGETSELIDASIYTIEAEFAPDGEHIYYIRAKGYEPHYETGEPAPEGYDIYKLNRISGKSERVTEEEFYTVSNLDVSTDGTHLLYSVYDGKDLLIRKNMQTGEVEHLFPGGGYQSESGHGPLLSDGALSPDGQKVAFIDVADLSDRGTYLYEAFVMDVDGEPVEQVTNFHTHVAEPVFFPNGKELMVTSNKNFASGDPEYEYWRVSLDGKNRKEIILNLPEK